MSSLPDLFCAHRQHAGDGGRPGDERKQYIVDRVKDMIAAYKCPKSAGFREQSLPRSGAGKILGKNLRAPCWAGRDRHVS
jgi:acyl-coenzyme A synthetase/AMP-(fatty) acid ligase